MANSLLAFPRNLWNVGLLGNRPQAPSAFMRQAQAPIPADAGDEMFLRPGAMQFFPAEAPQMAPQQPQQSSQQASLPQRGRVSGWRVLDRVLGGQTISEGLDAERARLMQEAMLPQQMAQRQRVMQLVSQMPAEAQLAYALNPEKFGENLSEQFAPQVISAGGSQRIAGTGNTFSNPSFTTVGDTIYRNDPASGASTVTATAPPSFADQTARINANNPVTVAQNGLLVDPRTGQTIAQGVQRPDVVSLSPGAEALALDGSGNVVSRVASTQQRPASAAEIKRADDLELQITQDNNAISRVSGLLGRIQSGEIDISPLANASAGVRNALGMSNQNSLGLAELKTVIETLKNSILNDATGPQTEGDALRALNSILAGINDPRVVAQGLQEFLRAKQNVTRTRQGQLARLRSSTSDAPPPPPGFVLD